jgi:tetraacyldisaccharide 4'-kinase
VFGNQDKDVSYFDLTKCAGSGIVLVTGIANPKPLKEYLQKFFGEIIDLPHPDHYSYKEKDINTLVSAYNNLRASSKYLMTTEKDAVRLREFTNIEEPLRSSFFYVPIGISFLNEDKDKFDNQIVDYVRKNKRHNSIS